MDPWAPINGISLERYAELSAEVSDTQDPNAQAEIVSKLGVSRADWEAAKSGWTARMQDMSLMGQVATRFMPMYNAALAKKKPARHVSFDDYVAMSGCVPVIGYEGMLAHYKVSQAEWTQISSHWNVAIQQNPQYSQWGLLLEQESARIRAGGAPKPVTFLPAPAGGAPAPAAGGAAPGGMPAAAPNPYAQQQANPYGAQQPFNPYAQQQQANPYAQHAQQPYNPYAQQQAYAAANPFGTPAQQQAFGNQVDAAFGSFTNALGSFVDSATGYYQPGTRVNVLWSDGNRYPATVVVAQNGQVQVAFPDGRRSWIPSAYVYLA